ncbi:MAG: helix-turn-helix transcriptional regulator [Myxococcales bacterium]|nr:helix-turn-helix transcriptional regulator [Myxococcales bacterium]
MSNGPESERRRTLLGVVLYLLIALTIGSDLVADYSHGAGSAHLGLEAFVVALASVGGVAFARHWLSLRQQASEARAEADVLRGEAAQLESRLAEQKAEAARWQSEVKELIDGLGAAIDRQFERWALSPAEREIGLLLLKGLSHQEVADLRGVSERTVRQQAQSLYKKAGLSGRADLAAYFLEDLLLPRTKLKRAEPAEP